MKKEQDYFRDLAEIRSMMERSSKFMSLSGWAGILAGIYALIGAYFAYGLLNSYGLEDNSYVPGTDKIEEYFPLIALFMLILVLALGTAIFLSHQKAGKRGERAWNTTSKRLLAHMAIPLAAGGLLILILLSKGLIFLAAPISLIFYGIALYNASKFTFEVLKYLGLIQIMLGLAGACFPGYGLLLWAVGFGAFHIAYGTYMHFKYER
jgi:hypothetical protein